MTTDATPRLRAVLANREFRALWFAETQSLVGDQLTVVALSILVYDRTGSALWTAAVYGLTFLPALAGGLGLSQLADLFPRRTVLVATSLLQAVCIGLMAVPGTPIAVLCLLIVLAKLAAAPGISAQNSLGREIFTDDHRYLQSQDLRGISANTATLLGLAGGGLLVTALGTSWALTIDALTYLIGAIVVQAGVRVRPAAGERGAGWFGAIKYVFGQPRLRVLIWLSWLVGFAVIPEGVAVPLVHELGASNQAVGWLLAADPLGFVIGTFLLSRYVSPDGRRRALGLLAIVPLLLLTTFAFKPNLIVSMLILGLAGAAGAYFITVGATYITWVPNEIRGAAGGLYRTGLRVVQGIGVAIGGGVAQLLGSAGTAIAVAGAVGVVVAVPIAVSWTRVRNASSPGTVAP
ncbi:MFS transporter [Amycolatopsis sp. NPDC059021]|uniref:MFS transporter n=1 Tax=Amycolatopsis sp. NPDC059021 TaxID=3346704 RepID=UPI003672C285